MAFSTTRPSRGLPDNVILYDTEATGLSTTFDQILQVAALKTDLSFGPATATFVGRACRCAHIVPSPGAMLKTRTSPHDLEHEGWPAHVLMDAVEETFQRWGQAVFVGYNSLRFDERLLRQNLFATLHHPYLTQGAGSMRADAMVLAQTVAALTPDAITVPIGATGAPSFALGPLCRANGIDFQEHAAHDALADTNATHALLRLLCDRASDALAGSLVLADREYVHALVRRHPVLLRLRWRRGAPFVQAVTPVGSPPGDRNAILLIDLAVDPFDYEARVDDGALDDWLQANPDAVTVVRANAFPQLFAPDADLTGIDRLRAILRRDHASDMPVGNVLRDMAARAERVQVNPALHARLFLARERRWAKYPPATTVEQRLYERFVPPGDLDTARAMHAAMPWERASYIDRFRDDRMRTLAARWVHGTEPGSLPADESAAIARAQRERMLGPADAPSRTIAAARLELDALLATAEDSDRERLGEIGRYIAWIESTALATV